MNLPFLSTETDRHGNVRIYVRKYGRRIRLREAPGTPEFARAYASALERLAAPVEPLDSRPARTEPKANTFGWLALQYYASRKFQSLDPISQRTRQRIIDSCLPEVYTFKDDTKAQVRECTIKHITSGIVLFLCEQKISKPGAANNRRKYLSAMFKWAISAKHMTINPCRDVEKQQYATDGFHAWTASELTAFENRHPIGTKARLAMSLLLYLGVRKGDVVRLSNSMVSGDPKMIKFIPNKTRHRRRIESVKPILPILEHILAQSPTGTDTLLETDFGKPFTANGFGNWFRKRCDEAGLPQCSAHGLRKLGATRCAENGATEWQIAALFDWSNPAQAAVYTRAASRQKLAAGAAKFLN